MYKPDYKTIDTNINKNDINIISLSTRQNINDVIASKTDDLQLKALKILESFKIKMSVRMTIQLLLLIYTLMMTEYIFANTNEVDSDYHKTNNTNVFKKPINNLSIKDTIKNKIKSDNLDISIDYQKEIYNSKIDVNNQNFLFNDNTSRTNARISFADNHIEFLSDMLTNAETIDHVYFEDILDVVNIVGSNGFISNDTESIQITLQSGTVYTVYKILNENGSYTLGIPIQDLSLQDIKYLWGNLSQEQKKQTSLFITPQVEDYIINNFINNSENNTLNKMETDVIFNKYLFNNNDTEHILERFSVCIDKINQIDDEKTKLLFLTSLGEIMGNNYDENVMNGKTEREIITTEELLKRIAKNKAYNAWENKCNYIQEQIDYYTNQLSEYNEEDSIYNSILDKINEYQNQLNKLMENELQPVETGAICGHIHLAISNIAKDLGFKSETIGVASSAPHAICGIELSNGKIAFIDYSKLYETNAKDYKTALVEFEKINGLVTVNRFFDEKGNQKNILKTESQKEKEKIIRNVNDGEIGEHKKMIDLYQLPDGRKIQISNNLQQLQLHKNGMTIELTHKNFKDIPEISFQDLFGIHFDKSILLHNNKFQIGTTGLYETYKQYGDIPKRMTGELALNTNWTYIQELFKNNTYKLSIANTLSGLMSYYILHNEYKSNKYSFVDGRITNVNSLKYTYIDPTSSNKFYIILGTSSEAGTNVMKGNQYIFNGIYSELGNTLLVKEGIIIDGSIKANQYGDFIESEGKINIQNDEFGTLSLNAKKSFDNSKDQNLVNQSLGIEIGYSSKPIQIMNLYAIISIIGKNNQNGNNIKTKFSIKF